MCEMIIFKVQCSFMKIKSYHLLLLMIWIITSCKNTTPPESETMTSKLSKATNDWKLSWSEEFSSDSLDVDTWNRQVEKAGRFNEEWQRYTDDTQNAQIKNGVLEITAVHESDTHGMNQYSSARLNTAQKKTFSYGKIVAKIKLPQGAGLWPAFWMLGSNIDENGGDTPWPDCGEIDILELYGSKSDAVIEANAHFSTTQGTHDNMGATSYELDEGIFADDFHEFELEWNEKELIWRVDKQEYARMDITGDQFTEFHQEFFILLNVAVGGKWAGRPDETSTFPQKMYVDWIRYYQKV